MTFLGLLAVLFIGLKLTHFITWSWWLVLLPLYGGVALWFVIVFLISIVAAVSKL